MAVAAKNRRSIEVGGQSYLWWVAEDEEAYGAFTLTVVSQDKHLLVKYQLIQPDETRHLVVLGRSFRQRTDCGGPWRRFRCPAFGADDMVTPRDVARLIEWCTTDSDALIEIDWRGCVISTTAG